MQRCDFGPSLWKTQNLFLNQNEIDFSFVKDLKSPKRKITDMV